jgi:myo-inositol-1(or 4)-monophosphatase
VGCGFYYDRGAMMRRTLKAIEHFFGKEIHGIRRMGAASLDLAMVGCGWFGGFFEYQLSPWDFAAGRLFIEEAGGKLTTTKGEALPISKTCVLASNGHLHEKMLEIVRD